MNPEKRLLIEKLLREGWSYRDIASEVGLSHERIGQINKELFEPSRRDKRFVNRLDLLVDNILKGKVERLVKVRTIQPKVSYQTEDKTSQSVPMGTVLDLPMGQAAALIALELVELCPTFKHRKASTDD